MNNYKYYRNVVFFIIVPNLILAALMFITKNKIISYLWVVSCFIYFIAFAVQPDKVFFRKKTNK